MADKDRVQVPSRNKDGSVDQTPDYELIGDPETTKAAIAEQLGQMKVSEVDAQRAAAQAATEGPTLSAEEQARVDEHNSLFEQAASEAEAEVAARTASGETTTAKKTSRTKSVETATNR